MNHLENYKAMLEDCGFEYSVSVKQGNTTITRNVEGSNSIVAIFSNETKKLLFFYIKY